MDDNIEQERFWNDEAGPVWVEHQERLEGKSKGKTGPGTSGKPRPGNRDVDPKRTDRYV